MRRSGYWQLIWYKGMADLHAEAARAYVGFIWWILEPLLYMVAFYVAFGMGLRGPGGGAVALSLLCGLVPWKWFASSVQNGSNIIQANSGLIMQVYLPKYVLPGMVMVTNGIKFLIILGLLMLAMAIVHGPSRAWLALPVVVVVEMLLALALCSLAAAIVPLLPDLDLVISNGLIVLMFLSGIFQDISTLPPRMARFLALNPMVHVIRAFRTVLLEQRWPDWTALAGVTAFALATYGLALALLNRYDRIYPKLLVG
ncbi:MAG TPA: ABC transporter permease [Gammaproteobacteria bacterium]|nr:ABC transporter permease [Gammaproteobacteria bacterium]